MNICEHSAQQKRGEREIRERLEAYLYSGGERIQKEVIRCLGEE